MPTISGRVSALANAVTANVFAGNPFEFIAAPSIINLAVTQAGATGAITANFQLGGEALMNGGNISSRAAFPTFRDDMIAMAGGSPGERLFLTFTNTTGAAVNVDFIAEITPL